MANESIREVVVNGNSYPIEADTSEIVAQLTAEDDLKFQFSKSGTNYGYLDGNGNFVPFKNPTGTKSITANGTYDVTDYASARVNVNYTYELTSPRTAVGRGQPVSASLYLSSGRHTINAAYLYTSWIGGHVITKDISGTLSISSSGVTVISNTTSGGMKKLVVDVTSAGYKTITMTSSVEAGSGYYAQLFYSYI